MQKNALDLWGALLTDRHEHQTVLSLRDVWFTDRYEYQAALGFMGSVTYRSARTPNCFRFFLLCDQKKKPNKKENVTQRRGDPFSKDSTPFCSAVFRRLLQLNRGMHRQFASLH